MSASKAPIKPLAAQGGINHSFSNKHCHSSRSEAKIWNPAVLILDPHLRGNASVSFPTSIDRRKSQTYRSPPAEPGVYLNKLGTSYPEPIVDPAQSREQALGIWDMLKHQLR